VALENLDFSDKKVWEVFQKGLTTGIFQFESGGMKLALKMVGVSSLEELAICNALYRPGTKDYIQNFADRKHNKEEFEYLHPDLEPILNNSYGIIVFQEQLIDIGRLANIKNPDDIRIATAKKKQSVLEKVKPELNKKLLEKDWEQNTFDKLWEQIEKFAFYSFNRAHAFLYSVVAFQTAYLKVYHPMEYVCATLNSFKGKIDDLKDELNLLQENKICVEKLDYKTLCPTCMTKDGKFYYGTGLIKGCNENIAYEFKKIKDITFSNFTECITTIIDRCSINSKQLETLIKLGAFSEFGGNKRLLKVYQSTLDGESKYDKKHKDATKEKRKAILQNIEKDTPNENYSITEQLDFENEYIGAIMTRYSIHKRYCYVKEINTKFAPRVELYCFNSGKSESVKIRKRIFNTDKLKKGDIVYCDAMKEEPALEYVGGEYVKSAEKTDWWLNKYRIISNFEDIVNQSIK
jgi:DNA polymerase-3 subunit alpha